MEKNKKIIIMIIILVIVFAAMFLLLFSKFRKQEDKNFTLRNIVISIGHNLSDDVSQYINGTVENAEKFILDLSNVDISKEGTYTYSVSLGNLKKNGTIEVINDVYVEAKDVYLEVGETLDRGKLLSYCSFDKYTIRVSNKELVYNEPGEYPINFLVIKDDYVREFNITAHVYNKGTLNTLKTNDISYSRNSYSYMLNIKESVYYVKFDKALENLSSVDSEIFKEMHDKSNLFENSKINIVYIYNKYDYIIGLAAYIELQGDSIYEPKYMFLHKEQS